MKRLIPVITTIFMSVSGASGQTDPVYEVFRINDRQPVITQGMFSSAGVHMDGENINGPSVIRVPDWIAPEDRADPEAHYYLYFAHHDGPYIRMAWAKEIEGPWHLYSIGSNVELGNRGVLDYGGHSIALENGIVIENNHLASPDAIVDHENQRIILYFHCGSSTFVNGEEINSQLSYVSTSSNGLDFYDDIEPVILGPSYFRVFEFNQDLYALTNDGTPYRAPDGENPWLPPGGFDFKNRLWEKHPDNPFQRDITDAGIDKAVLRVRHTGVRVVGDDLHVFYSRRGDSPERIQMSTIDLGVGDWGNWDATYPPIELLKAEPGWEGGEIPPAPSETSSAPENVNQLRDPDLFEDEDGSLYLFYTGRGEDAIGIAAMYYLESLPSGEDLTDLEGVAITGSNDDEPWIGPEEGAGSPPGEEADMLIDNDNLTKYTVRSEASWVEIEPGRFSQITGYTIAFAPDHPERDPKIWELQGWDDSLGDWVSLHAFIQYPIREARFKKLSWTINNESWYSKYRLNITDIYDEQQGLMQIAELQIFGIPGGYVAVDGTHTPRFSVFPNPTSGLIHISNPSTNGFSYEIYSMSGRKVSAANCVEGGLVRVDLDGLPKGMYIITISGEGTTVREKVVLQ